MAGGRPILILRHTLRAKLKDLQRGQQELTEQLVPIERLKAQMRKAPGTGTVPVSGAEGRAATRAGAVGALEHVFYHLLYGLQPKLNVMENMESNIRDIFIFGN